MMGAVAARHGYPVGKPLLTVLPSPG